MKNLAWLLPVLLWMSSGAVDCSKVLMAISIGTPSQTNIFRGIAESLIEGGHEVTYVSPFKSSQKTEHLTEITYSNGINEKLLAGVGFGTSIFTTINLFTNIGPDVCFKNMMEVEETINQKYDIVFLSLIFTQCFLVVPYQQNIPFILISPNTIGGSTSKLFGNVDFLSFTTSRLSPTFHPMTFFERLQNALVISMFDPIIAYQLKCYDSICKELGICTPDMPSIAEMERNASFAFINSVRSLETPPRPMSPSVIYTGGIHIKAPKALPQDLKNFMDHSGDKGVILFSLGSAVKSSTMEEKHLHILLQVFKSLDYRILWKWDEEEIEGLPSNVMLSKWVPQQDVLGHPNIKLFITHGGLLSTQEATWFGVPLIGLPVFGDQFGNMAEVVTEGWGKMLQWKELTVESLNNTIHFTIEDENIRRKCEYRSMIMKDQQNSPADEVRYWTEYAIKYNGAHHLQSPIARMPWYKIYNMDVWAFVAFVLLAIITCTLLLLKKLFSLLCRRRKTPKTKSKTQ